MIEVTNSRGLPMHVNPQQISAFGPIDNGKNADCKSWIAINGHGDSWELRTEYKELQRLILESSKCKSSGIEYL